MSEPFEIKVGEVYRRRPTKSYVERLTASRVYYTKNGQDWESYDSLLGFHQEYEPIPPAPGLVMTEEEATELLRDVNALHYQATNGHPGFIDLIETIHNTIQSRRERTRRADEPL